MSGVEEGNAAVPRALIHQRILDAAAEQPDVSVARLADEISGASPELVERVLSTYGDPAEEEGAGAASQPAEGSELDVATETPRTASLEDEAHEDAGPVDDETETQQTTADTDRAEATATTGETLGGDAEATDTTTAPEQETATDNATRNQSTPETDNVDAEDDTDDVNDTTETQSQDAPPALPSLTSKQRQTLEAIHANPDATQAEIAAQFDVTPATISAHVNAVEGFEWDERATFVQQLFDDTDSTSVGSGAETHVAEPDSTPGSDTASEDTEHMPRTDARLEEIETSLAEIKDLLEATDTRPQPSIDMESDLLHKVVHACMESEHISSDEELRIIQSLLP